MRILFLTQVLPYPLDAGPKVRAYYVLRHLAQHHQVTLLSFVRDTDTAAAVDHLRSFCADVQTVPIKRSTYQNIRHLLRSLLSTTPFLIARDWSNHMAAHIEDAVLFNEFDAVHADQLWMAPYALWAQEVAAKHGRVLKIVLDQHNAVFQIPRRLAQQERNFAKRLFLHLEAYKLVRFELDTYRLFDHVVWVTQEDRSALQAKTQYIQTQDDLVIPICIDPDSIPTVARVERPHRVLFLGGMHWPPNAEGIRWFAEKVWPQVHGHVSHAMLTLIGKDPPVDLTRMTSQVDVLGYVDRLDPYLAETAVFIVPLHAGGGMRVKILDAWCWGLPVVSTTVGAEGIIYRDRENILIADDENSLAAGIIQLLEQPEVAARIGQAGRRAVEQEYNWHIVYQQWESIYGA